jgi:ABC-2 type transport system ATP-binding protein
VKLRVEGLVRRFGDLVAVDAVSFTVGAGQVCGFVGPNGAGKTTTMRILATLDEPDAGDAFLDGFSILEQPERARRRIGFVPDTLPAHADVTVAEYLDFFARAYGIQGEDRRRTLAGVEAFTGVAPLRDKHLKALSKGMKQRVSVARALVHDPAVLILDEPAAGLDPRARVELRELLRALAEQGKAVLISSHILSELAEICDAAVILERGRIVGAGDIDTLAEGGGLLRAGQEGEEAPPPVRKVRLRTLDGTPSLLAAVLETPGVLKAQVVGKEVEAHLEGDDGAVAALLVSLVQRGVPVVELRQQRAGLEELFLRVTRGEVQ